MGFIGDVRYDGLHRIFHPFFGNFYDKNLGAHFLALYDFITDRMQFGGKCPMPKPVY